MINRYIGKVAIVTGAASGIGAAVARNLVGEGALVIAADIDAAGIEVLAASLGEACIAVRTDVTREADVAAMVEAATREFGQLDALFNVAGAARISEITETTEADWNFVIDLCVKGTFLSMKHAGRRMAAASTKGAIVNIGSVNGRSPGWGMSAYNSAKAAVEMLGKSGSLEFGRHGIRVNTVSPGVTATPVTDYMSEEMSQAFIERIPLARFATVEDVASACLFLGSDDAAYINGANLFVDGGWVHGAYPDTQKFFCAGA